MQKKKLFFAGIVLCLVVAVTGFYLYQKPRASLDDIPPAYTLDAAGLYNSFQQNEKKANEQYVGKVLLVKGTVDNVQVTDSTISVQLSSGNDMGGINCSVAKGKNNKNNLPSKGSLVQVKGRCVGFLMDVNLVDALIEQ